MKNRVKAIAELNVGSKFGVVNTVEEVIAKGIKMSAAEAARRGRREKGYTKFAAKMEGVISVREAVRDMVLWETM